MNFDLRIPVGLMFTVFGLILTAVGALHRGDPAYLSLGINMNLRWGLVMLIFGIAMLLLARRGRDRR